MLWSKKRIQDVAPSAIYIHCHAHILNLALVDSVKNVQYCSEFFNLLESLYVFMSSSKRHDVFTANQKKFYPNQQIRQLKKLCDTRWACWQAAVSTICSTYNSVIQSLEDISESSDSEAVIGAKGLLNQVKSFKFLLLLIIFDRLLSCTKSLSDYLQQIKINLAKAVYIEGNGKNW